MWSGPPQWTQWALNPSAYQDMANDQVDWARLAQQWIMMKEAAPVNLPEPPPPAMEKPIGEEGGEAPMDIGKDEDGDEPNDAPPAGWNNSSNWNNWSQQWGGYSSWSPGAHAASQVPHAVGNSLLPNPSVTKNGADPTAYSYSTTAPGFEYSTAARGDAFHPPAGFWPDGMMPPGAAGTQMPFVRGGHGRGQRWEGKAKIGRGQDMQPSDEEEEAEPVIDAAKRRTLPIWIREGLEKMEREKQKQLERERAEKAREEALKLRRQKEQEVMNEIQAEKGVPPRSKFDTDSEEGSEDEVAPLEQRDPSPPVVSELPKRKSRFHDGPPRPPSPIRLTKEEQMLKVRRTMTEVLLEVTSEMLRSVARESFVWYQRKAPAKQTPPKNSMAVASLKANLGLAMYGSGSEGDSDSESDQEGGTRNQTASKAPNSSGDSDSELRDEIRRRQQDFKEQEREIEALAAEAEERERRGGRGVSAGREQTTAEVTDSGSGVIPERQVESESASHTTDAGKDAKSKTEVEVKSSNHKSNEKNDKNNHKSSKSDKKKKSDSSVSSDESSSSSRSSKRRHKRKHKDRKKEKEKRRSKERDRKSRRDRSSSTSRRDSRKSRRERSNSTARRSRSRSRSRHRDDDSKKRRRDRSDSRRRSRKRSHSSDSDRRRSSRRRSRSRSGSLPRNRHRRRRSSSRSSSDSSRHRRSSRR